MNGVRSVELLIIPSAEVCSTGSLVCPGPCRPTHPRTRTPYATVSRLDRHPMREMCRLAHV
jgi:hypothetical protein